MLPFRLRTDYSITGELHATTTKRPWANAKVKVGKNKNKNSFQVSYIGLDTIKKFFFIIIFFFFFGSLGVSMIHCNDEFKFSGRQQ